MDRPKWSTVLLAVPCLVILGWSGSAGGQGYDWMDKVDPGRAHV